MEAACVETTSVGAASLEAATSDSGASLDAAATTKSATSVEPAATSVESPATAAAGVSAHCGERQGANNKKSRNGSLDRWTHESPSSSRRLMYS
ncbi:MAG TPA: hypothetical protein VGL41_16380, partial [Roseiarcus sp.]